MQACFKCEFGERVAFSGFSAIFTFLLSLALFVVLGASVDLGCLLPVYIVF